METGFIILMVLMILFGVLATYDGIYLHIFKYRLYEQPESRFEHLTHTIRAVLFPVILYFLYLENSVSSFYLGLAFVSLDIITLGFDAYMEKDSRAFMGGLPRWEYIIHLFVNGFHFAAIAVFLVLKVDFTANGYQLHATFPETSAYNDFIWLIENLIPGGIFMGLLHVFVCFKRPALIFNKFRSRVNCC